MELLTHLCSNNSVIVRSYFKFVLNQFGANLPLQHCYNTTSHTFTFKADFRKDKNNLHSIYFHYDYKYYKKKKSLINAYFSETVIYGEINKFDFSTVFGDRQ